MEKNSNPNLLKTKSNEEGTSHNKRRNFKGKQLSFSQASEISEDTKEDHKLLSPVRIFLCNNILNYNSYQLKII